MLKAIGKFVIRRSRGVYQRRPQIGEDDKALNPRDDSEVALQLAEPQLVEPELAEPASPPVSGRVKWYNPDKRFGFVELSAGGGDAFLHATALSDIGISTLQPGETLELRVAPGQRGPQVTEIISVDSSTATPSRPRKSFRSPSDRQPLEASVQEMGTVKWYNATKGFGFVAPAEGGKDVFVHASALQRAGVMQLAEGQTIWMDVVQGAKGPEAASIRVG